MQEQFKDQKAEAKQRSLLRFIHAQDSGGIVEGTSTYEQALQEIKNGRKTSHWIWYVFPQMAGIPGTHSRSALFYGINGREEAYAYIENPILRDRLIEATRAVLESDHTVYEIFGSDTIKVRACMKLFASVSDIPEFKQLIAKYRW